VCDEIYVVDSFSTDQTVEIAQRSGAKVLQNKFVNYARQFEWAMRNAPISTDWVLRFDADELLTDELAEELTRTLSTLPPDVTGLNMNRRHVFLGKWIRHGGRYPLTLLRAWRKDCAKIEQRWMDEHIKVDGVTMALSGAMIDDNLRSLAWWIEKHNGYSSREAVDLLNLEYQFAQQNSVAALNLSQSSIGLKRWIKENIYAKLPGGARSLSYFLWRYIVLLGFLDGSRGTQFHFLQALWYRYLVDCKVAEVKRYMKEHDVSAALAIKAVLGIDLRMDS
jgi:glycosyltransferase involved in cell wall biosynthesis